MNWLVLIEKTGKHLRIVNMGADNGWFSNRLASRGHEVAALDLTINDFDGLGCHCFYDANSVDLLYSPVTITKGRSFTNIHGLAV